MNTLKFFFVALVAMTVLAFSAVSTAPAFAGGDEEYEVKQKIKIEQDCDQTNENEDSPFAGLFNEQACNAEAFNLNDIVVVPSEPREE